MAYRWKIFTNSVSVQSTVSNSELSEFNGWVCHAEVGLDEIRDVSSRITFSSNVQRACLKTGEDLDKVC